ncbi:hypothetical protein JHK86_021988 [Glycine max]|nr:hypothetical protein JHK86_021988 [Glycine max]
MSFCEAKAKPIAARSIISLSNGNHIHVFPTNHDPGLRWFSGQARPEQQEARFLQLVGSAVRMARGSGLHRPIAEDELSIGSGAGSGPGPAQIQIRSGVLHGEEGKRAAEEDRGNVDVSRHHVPLRYCVQARVRCF